MTYQYIPNPNDKLSKSQADIKSNFTLLDTTIGTNHFAPTASSNAGKHKFVEMVNQTIPATAASEGSLYTKQATSISPSNQSQLFYTSDNGGIEYQLTRCIDIKKPNFASINNGWTFLPGGMLMMYGTTSVASGNAVILFNSLSLPDFSAAMYQAQISLQRTTSSPGSSFSGFWVDNTTISKTGFTIINNTGHSFGFYWIAIGV